MQFEAKPFTTNYSNRVVHVFKAVICTKFRLYMLKLIHILGHFLRVNCGCYGRCYLKRTYTTVYFP